MTNSRSSRKEMERLAESLVMRDFVIDLDNGSASASEERRLAQLWHALGDAPAPKLSSELDQAIYAVDDRDDLNQIETRSNWKIPALERWAAVFVIFALSVSMLVAFQPWSGTTEGSAEIFVAERAEVRDIRLADGSTLKLSPQTAVEVTLGDRTRRLRLVRGEALFTVAHDPSRPFIVGVGDSEVQAIGTVFNIRRIGVETEVTVIEGRIALTIAGGQQGQPSRRELGVGERVRFGLVPRSEVAVASSTQTTVNVANVEAATDWTRRELSFDGEPLRDVITEMNRYGRDDIILLELGLAEIPVYGILHGGDVDGLMGIISELAAEQGLTERPAARVDRAER